MRRFSSRAPRGWPAVGLLLIRVAMAVTLAYWRPTAHRAELIAALLLLGGMWTPIVAAVVAGVECWRAALQSGGGVSLLLTAMALALVLKGPGTWSIDARVLGWRWIEIPVEPTKTGRRRSDQGDAGRRHGWRV
jgi:uncharacterized membrane protein YphA (DoxX/SURF4 family)